MVITFNKIKEVLKAFIRKFSAVKTVELKAGNAKKADMGMVLVTTTTTTDADDNADRPVT